MGVRLADTVYESQAQYAQSLCLLSHCHLPHPMGQRLAREVDAHSQGFQPFHAGQVLEFQLFEISQQVFFGLQVLDMLLWLVTRILRIMTHSMKGR